MGAATTGILFREWVEDTGERLDFWGESVNDLSASLDQTADVAERTHSKVEEIADVRFDELQDSANEMVGSLETIEDHSEKTADLLSRVVEQLAEIRDSVASFAGTVVEYLRDLDSIPGFTRLQEMADQTFHLEQRMMAFGNSTVDAKRVVGEFMRSTVATGATLQETARSFEAVQVALAGYNLSNKDAQDIVRGLSLEFKNMGLSVSEVPALFLGLQQQINSAKVDFESISGIVANISPAMFNKLAVEILKTKNALAGVSDPIDAVRNLMRDGAVSGDDLAQSLAKMSREGNKLAGLSQGWASDFEKMDNAVNNLVFEFDRLIGASKSLLSPAMADWLDLLARALRKINDEGIKKFIQDGLIWLKKTFDDLENSVGTLYDKLSALPLTFESIGKAWGIIKENSKGAMTVGIVAVLAAIVALGTPVKAILAGMLAGLVPILDILKSIALTILPWRTGIFVTIFLGLLKGLSTLFTKWAEKKSGTWGRLMRWMAKNFSDTVDWMIEKALGFAEWLLTTYGKIFSAIFGSFKLHGKDAVDYLKEQINTIRVKGIEKFSFEGFVGGIKEGLEKFAGDAGTTGTGGGLGSRQKAYELEDTVSASDLKSTVEQYKNTFENLSFALENNIGDADKLKEKLGELNSQMVEFRETNALTLSKQAENLSTLKELISDTDQFVPEFDKSELAKGLDDFDEQWANLSVMLSKGGEHAKTAEQELGQMFFALKGFETSNFANLLKSINMEERARLQTLITLTKQFAGPVTEAEKRVAEASAAIDEWNEKIQTINTLRQAGKLADEEYISAVQELIASKKRLEQQYHKVIGKTDELGSALGQGAAGLRNMSNEVKGMVRQAERVSQVKRAWESAIDAMISSVSNLANHVAGQLGRTWAGDPAATAREQQRQRDRATRGFWWDVGKAVVGGLATAGATIIGGPAAGAAAGAVATAGVSFIEGYVEGNIAKKEYEADKRRQQPTVDIQEDMRQLDRRMRRYQIEQEFLSGEERAERLKELQSGLVGFGNRWRGQGFSKQMAEQVDDWVHATNYSIKRMIKTHNEIIENLKRDQLQQEQDQQKSKWQKESEEYQARIAELEKQQELMRIQNQIAEESLEEQRKQTALAVAEADLLRQANRQVVHTREIGTLSQAFQQGVNFEPKFDMHVTVQKESIDAVIQSETGQRQLLKVIYENAEEVGEVAS